MKFKSLIILSFFLSFTLLGLFLPFLNTQAATGACRCYIPSRSATSLWSPDDPTCASSSACTTACRAGAPGMGATPAETAETTGDCVGAEETTATPTTTATPSSTQCTTVNPECTADWEAGLARSRFISNRDCYCCGDCGFNDIVNIFINAADYLFGVLGALALLFFIYGGLVWLTSGGSAGQIDKGKKILLGAVIGMVLALGAWLIVKFLVTALGVTTPVTGF